MCFLLVFTKSADCVLNCFPNSECYVAGSNNRRCVLHVKVLNLIWCVRHPFLKRAMDFVLALSFKHMQKWSSSPSSFPLPSSSPSPSPSPAPLGNLRWRRFRGDGDRTGRESLELTQPSLPIKNRTLRSQWTQKDGEYRRGKYGFT